MNQPFPQHIQHLVNECVDGEQLRSEEDVIFAALSLLKQYQSHRRLKDQLELAASQLDKGAGTEFGTSEIADFFDAIKRDGRSAVEG
jgi:hypothetical protein